MTIQQWIAEVVKFIRTQSSGSKTSHRRFNLPRSAPEYLIRIGLENGWLHENTAGGPRSHGSRPRLLRVGKYNSLIKQMLESQSVQPTPKEKRLMVTADVSNPEQFFRSKAARPKKREPVKNPRGPMTPRVDRMVEAEQIADKHLRATYPGYRVYKLEGSLDFLLSHPITKDRIWYEVKLKSDGLSETQVGMMAELRLTNENVRGLQIS